MIHIEGTYLCINDFGKENDNINVFFGKFYSNGMIAWLINIPNSLPSSLHPRVWGLLENFNYFDSTKQGKEKSLGWYTFIYNAVQCTQECIRVVHDYISIFKRKVQNIDH